MSKKPVPSKKQAVSSTRSRHAAYVRRKRLQLGNKSTYEKCKKCGAVKRRHFVCDACGYYQDRQVFVPKTSRGATPVQEIEA